MPLILFLGGACAFLYFFTMPRETEAKFSNELRRQEISTVRAGGSELATRDSGRAWPDENRAVAAGIGRIPDPTAQGLLLARRSALTDARRNLLLLRQKLLGDPAFDRNAFAPDTGAVAGRVAAHRVLSERVEGDLYFLEIEIRLDRLLRPDFSENMTEIP